MDKPEWILYVKTRCPWCVQAVAYLQKHGYAFTEIDVLRDKDAFAKMRQLSGQSLTPTLVIGDLLLPDFGVDELEDFLKQNQLRPHAP